MILKNKKHKIQSSNGSTRNDMRKFRTILNLVLVGLLLISINGCVVKRLFEFKNQLKDPRRYIHFKIPGVLVLTKPVLQLEDIELLTGISPSELNQNSATYYFIREDSPVHSLTYKLVFKDKKLHKIDYPDIFFNAIASSFAFESLALFGQASNPEQSNWSITNSGQTLSSVPTQDEMVSLLGPPSSKVIFSFLEIYHYDYLHPTINGQQKIRISINFHLKTKIIEAITIIFPDRQWQINL